MEDNPIGSDRQPPEPMRAMLIRVLVGIGLIVALVALAQFLTSTQPPPADNVAAVDELGPTATSFNTSKPTPTPPPTSTPTPTQTRTPTPTSTPTNTPTPTPTIDLVNCNVVGCEPGKTVTPLASYDYDLFLAYEPHQRRVCEQCPPNEYFSEAELDTLLAADPATLARLERIVISQQAYEIAPGVVYMVFDNGHHIVIDTAESGLKLRNIVPPIPNPEMRREVRITPSYCMSPNTLVVTTADYHGLDSNNKTETGLEIFFNMGRAALFQVDGQFDIDVITEESEFARTTVSWGGGPIFIWDGQYNFNPKNEWFTPENLAHYETTIWSKITVAISQDRRYLFLSASYNKTLEEHAQSIISLGQTWGIKVDRAMRFDGSESTYMAIRLGNYMVPVLLLKEALIVNCFAVEQDE